MADNIRYAKSTIPHNKIFVVIAAHQFDTIKFTYFEYHSVYASAKKQKGLIDIMITREHTQYFSKILRVSQIVFVILTNVG